MSFRCSRCGETHDGLPEYGFRFPDYYFGVPEGERESRIICNSDLCAIDNEEFFIRGVIPIPVHDQDADFGIGVWVSQKKENFEIYKKYFDSAEIGPFFGWLSNRIPFYEESSINLKTMVYFQGNNQRPLIHLEKENHPLCKAFHNGLTAHEVWNLIGEPNDDR